MNYAESFRNGGEMYEDTFNFKPPAIYYTYAIANTLFGYSAAGLRWSMIFFNVVGAGLLFLIGYRWCGALFASIAAISYAVFAFNPFVYGFAALSESYQNVYAIGAMAILQHALVRKKNYWYALAGALLAFSLLIKQNLIFACVGLFLVMLWYYFIERKDKEWKPMAFFLGGGLLSVILIYLPVIIQGNLDDLIYWNFTYSSQYATAVPWETGRRLLKNFFASVTSFNQWMWIAGVIGVAFSAYFSKSSALRMLLPILLLSSFVAVVPGYRFYPHYWIYLTPVLALGCAWFFEGVNSLISSKVKSPFISVGLMALFFVGLNFIRTSHPNHFDNPKELFVNRRAYGDNPFTENRFLGEYLRKQMSSSDELMVFGSEPEMYTYADRYAPHPYIFLSHLSKPHSRQPAMLADMKKWVTETKPKFAYFSNHPFSWEAGSEEGRNLHRWSWNYVNQHYRCIGIADIIPQQAPKIILGNEAENYKPTAQKWVGVYERVR